MEKLLNRLFFLILPVLLGLSLTFSYYNAQKSVQISEGLRQQNERLIEINAQQKKSLDTTKADIEDLKATLLCIGQFFNRDDRVNLKITSYSPCKIENTVTGEVTVVPIFLVAPQTTSATPQAPGPTLCDVRSNGSSSSPNNNPCKQTKQSDNSQNKSDVKR